LSAQANFQLFAPWKKFALIPHKIEDRLVLYSSWRKQQEPWMGFIFFFD
jgi:hypothetical protein